MPYDLAMKPEDTLYRVLDKVDAAEKATPVKRDVKVLINKDFKDIIKSVMLPDKDKK